MLHLVRRIKLMGYGLLVVTACAPLDAQFCDEPVAGSVIDLEVRDLTFIQTVDTSGTHLISGRSALARVHLVHHEASTRPLALDATVTLSLNGSATSATLVANGPRCVPRSDHDLGPDETFNAVVPVEWLVPGTVIGATVELAGNIDVVDVDVLRYPRAGHPSTMVHEPPPFAITFVPIDFGGTKADSSIAPNEYLDWSVKLFPLHDVDVDLRQPFYVEPTTPELELLPTYRHVLQLLATLRLAEAPERTYYGLMPMLPGIVGGGVAMFRQPVAVGSQFQGPNIGAGLVAHELGHTFGLLHAPCGMSGGSDPSYPNPDGTIGVWGRDPFTNDLYPPTTFDLMGGCPPWWISGYHYLKVLDFRRDAALETIDAEPVSSSRTLIVTGSIDGGEVELAPLLSTATRAQPPASGEWTFRLEDRDSVALLDVPFAPQLAVGEDDGFHLFAFSLAVSEDDLLRASRAHVLDDHGRVVSTRFRATAGSTPNFVLERADDGRTMVSWDGNAFMAALAVDVSSGRVLALGTGSSLAFRNQGSPVELTLSDGITNTRQILRADP